MEKKPWYASKSLWGGIVAMAAVGAQAFGHAVAPEEQMALVNGLASMGEVGGILMGIYGRVTAKASIG